MVELKPPIKKPWQLKAIGTTYCKCACWDCLRSRGITPDANSHETHRRNILPGSPLYSPATGRHHDSSIA